MTMNPPDELNSSSDKFSPADGPRRYSGVLNSPDELAARTIHCTVCGAPPNAACQHIQWNGMNPFPKPRKFHARRLKDYETVLARRERLNAAPRR